MHGFFFTGEEQISNQKRWCKFAQRRRGSQYPETNRRLFDKKWKRLPNSQNTMPRVFPVVIVPRRKVMMAERKEPVNNTTEKEAVLSICPFATAEKVDGGEVARSSEKCSERSEERERAGDIEKKRGGDEGKNGTHRSSAGHSQHVGVS